MAYVKCKKTCCGLKEGDSCEYSKRDNGDILLRINDEWQRISNQNFNDCFILATEAEEKIINAKVKLSNSVRDFVNESGRGYENICDIIKKDEKYKGNEQFRYMTDSLMNSVTAKFYDNGRDIYKLINEIFRSLLK